MSDTQQLLDTAHDKLRALPFGIEDLYFIHKATLKARDELRRRLLPSITGISGDRQSFPGIVIAAARSEAARDFAAISLLLSELEADQRVSEAVALVSPVMDEIAELESQLAAENQLAAQLESDRLEKLEAAKREAIAKVEADFANDLPPAPPAPVKPFRGKVRVPSTDEVEEVLLG
jgi:hypothetical protein